VKCTYCPAEATTTFSEDYTISCCPPCCEAQHAALSRIAQLVRGGRTIFNDERERVGWPDETALKAESEEVPEG
jgi:hypothetical protein